MKNQGYSACLLITHISTHDTLHIINILFDSNIISYFCRKTVVNSKVLIMMVCGRFTADRNIANVCWKPESAWQNMCVARGYEASLSHNLDKKYSRHLYVTLIISISVYQTVVI